MSEPPHGIYATGSSKVLFFFSLSYIPLFFHAAAAKVDAARVRREGDSRNEVKRMTRERECKERNPLGKKSVGAMLTYPAENKEALLFIIERTVCVC